MEGSLGQLMAGIASSGGKVQNEQDGCLPERISALFFSCVQGSLPYFFS